MLGDIDLNRKPFYPDLYICKPDRTIIGKLHEAFNIKRHIKLGNISELTFSVPVEIDINHELIKNYNIDKLKFMYLIKFVEGNNTEWYIIDSPPETIVDEEKDIIDVHAFSLGYELSLKLIRGYSVTSYNCTQVLTDILNGTIWNIDYVDAVFDLKYRSFDISSSTILEAVFQVAEAFGALIRWNTVNRTISFYQPDNIGIDRGLVVNYQKYLQALNRKDDSNEFCTRLKIYGKDGLSIQRVNPTGQNYIENFSYFLSGFQRDANKNVLSSSPYMSDSLCNAILDYNNLIETKTGEFNTLLSELETLQQILTTKQNELTTLKNELAIILDNLDIAQAQGNDTTQLLTDKANKEVEISTKQSEIDQVNNNIINKEAEIATLRNTLAIENNFTSEQIIERNLFIIEKEWTDDRYVDDKELYEAALKKFEELLQPKMVLDIDLVNFLQIVECQHDWDKLNLGDIIHVQYDKLGINVEAKIVEIETDYENNEIKLVISNVKDILTAEQRFLKDFYNSITTSVNVNMNKYKWNGAVATVDDVTQILNNVWQTAERAINAGVNESVEINRRGITIKDPTDPLKFVRLTHGVIGITNDGGNTYKQVIDGTGVYAQRLVGQIILGNLLTLTDDTGTFNISGNLLTVKDLQNIIRVQLGEYATGKYGLLLKDKTGNNVLLDEDGILQTWQEGRADNVDSTHPLVLNIYIPPETRTIRRALLRFRLQAFRAYETGAASGGGSTVTSVSGGGISTSTQSGGGSYQSSEGDIWHLYSTMVPDVMSWEGSHDHGDTGSVNNHNHGIPDGTGLVKADGGTVWFSASGGHYHGISYDGGHAHAIESAHYHDVDIPSHSHDFLVPSHAHDVNIPDHTHGMVFGIYIGSSSSTITVKINGVDRTSSLGGPFNTDQSNLNIKDYLVSGQWNTIELGSSGLGRIDASIFLQVLLGV